MRFEVGDVVVNIWGQSQESPPKGMPVRITAIAPWADQIALIFDRYPSDHPTEGWDANGFRKLRAATTDIFALADRRVDEQAPA